MDIYSIFRVIIQCYVIFVAHVFPVLPIRRYFILAPVSLCHILFNVGFSAGWRRWGELEFPYFLEQQDDPDSSCGFSASVLESAIFP